MVVLLTRYIAVDVVEQSDGDAFVSEVLASGTFFDFMALYAIMLVSIQQQT
jgi:hypothetical protein